MIELNFDEEMGVNSNGIIWLKVSEKTYYCRMYVSEGVELEKLFNDVDLQKVKQIDIEDMQTKASS